MKKQLRKLRERLEGRLGREGSHGTRQRMAKRQHLILGWAMWLRQKARARLHGELEGAWGSLDHQSSASSSSFSRKTSSPHGVLGAWAGRKWIAQHKPPRRGDVRKEVARSNARIREPCRV